MRRPLADHVGRGETGQSAAHMSRSRRSSDAGFGERRPGRRLRRVEPLDRGEQHRRLEERKSARAEVVKQRAESLRPDGNAGVKLPGAVEIEAA